MAQVARVQACRSNAYLTLFPVPFLPFINPSIIQAPVLAAARSRQAVQTQALFGASKAPAGATKQYMICIDCKLVLCARIKLALPTADTWSET